MRRHGASIVTTALAVVLSAAAPAQAGTITVTTGDDQSTPGECTLRDAFANADAGKKLPGNACAAGVNTPGTNKTNTIKLNDIPVHLTKPITLLNNEVTLVGGSVTGDHVTSMFIVDKFAHLKLQKMLLENGFSKGSGGAIVVNGQANLDIDSSELQNNVAMTDGGAIDFAGQFLNIKRVKFKGNAADFAGGAIRFRGEDLTVEQSTFDSNYAAASYAPGAGGGAIRCTGGGQISVKESRLIGNKVEAADTEGGAILTDCFTLLNIVDVQANETGGGNGAGVYVENSGSLEVRRSRFTSNITGPTNSTGKGAGIYTDGPLLVETSSLWGNKANEDGGAIYVADAASEDEIFIRNVTFTLNEAEGEGSAMWVTENSFTSTPQAALPFGRDYRFVFANNSVSANHAAHGATRSQLFFEQGSQGNNGQILFVNNLVNGTFPTFPLQLPCGGQVGRLAVRRENAHAMPSYNAQWPDVAVSCHPDIPTVSPEFVQGNGWYFKQAFLLPTNKFDEANPKFSAGDPVVCAWLGDVDQFEQPRTCYLGAIEGHPPAVTQPDIYE